MRHFAAAAVLTMSMIGPLAAAEATGTRCAPIDTVPGVKIRPASCPPSETTDTQTGTIRPTEALSSSMHSNSFRFNGTEVRVGGRVRIDGTAATQP
jgi:hypothetical protein